MTLPYTAYHEVQHTVGNQEHGNLKAVSIVILLPQKEGSITELFSTNGFELPLVLSDRHDRP